MGGQRVLVKLSPEERKLLEDFTNKGTHSSKLIKRAKVILSLDSSDGRIPLKEEDISKAHNISRSGIHIIKDNWLEGGVNTIITRKKRKTPPVEIKIDGDVEAHIIALACSEPPEGYSRWTLRLLADQSIELGIIDEISHTSIDRLLKKKNLSLT